jgi:hypothetical protein
MQNIYKKMQMKTYILSFNLLLTCTEAASALTP